MRFYLGLIFLMAHPILAADEYAAARAGMIEEIEETVSYTSEHIGKQTLSPGVMQVMARVPRHEFVAAELRPYAYRNRPLPLPVPVSPSSSVEKSSMRRHTRVA